MLQELDGRVVLTLHALLLVRLCVCVCVCARAEMEVSGVFRSLIAFCRVPFSFRLSMPLSLDVRSTSRFSGNGSMSPQIRLSPSVLL
jgi:hypothetical protein